MAQIHEPRLQIPPGLAPSETSTHSSASSLDVDEDESPLNYKHFSSLVQQSFDGISLSDLIIVKRSSWDALCRERDEEELCEEARKAIEKTYEEMMDIYKVTLTERYKEDMAKMAKRIAELEARADPDRVANRWSVNGDEKVKVGEGLEEKLVIAEERIRDLETKVDCLKLILAGRITDRERVSHNVDQYHYETEEDHPEAEWAKGATSEANEKRPVTQPVPTAPRTILHRNQTKNAPTASPRNNTAVVRPQQPRATPGIIARPPPQYATPRITTDRLVSESRTKRRAIYIVNLGPNFSLTALLSCVTQGPLERIVPYPYRGTCLFIFVHSIHAHAFFIAANSRTNKNPFAGKFHANVSWADQAISRMDYYVASRIVECSATRIVKFTGLEAALVGEGGERGEVSKEEIMTWWSRKNSYLIGVTVKEHDGRKEAVVECESVRDAWRRVQEVTTKVKEGVLKVGWEWVPDYCAAGLAAGG